MPDEFDEIEKALGAKAKPVGGVDEFDAIEQSLGLREKQADYSTFDYRATDPINPEGIPREGPAPDRSLRENDPPPPASVPSTDVRVIAWQAREMQRQQREREMEPPGQLQSVVAEAINILDQPTSVVGLRPGRYLATGGGDPEKMRRFERATEQAYEPAREVYGSGVADLTRDVTRGASGMIGLAPVVRGTTAVAGAGLRALKVGETVTKYAAPAIGFGLQGAGAETVRGLVEGDADGETIVRRGLHGLGFGAGAALTGPALAAFLNRLPPLAKKELAARIVTAMESGGTPAARDVVTLAQREMYTQALAQAGAMVGGGRVAAGVTGDPHTWRDDVVNALLGGVIGAKGHEASTGFGKAEGPIVGEMRGRAKGREATSFRVGPGGEAVPPRRGEALQAEHEAPLAVDPVTGEVVRRPVTAPSGGVRAPAPEAEVASREGSLAKERAEAAKAAAKGQPKPKVVRTGRTDVLLPPDDTVGGQPVRTPEPLPPAQRGAVSPFVDYGRFKPTPEARGIETEPPAEPLPPERRSDSPMVEYGPEPEYPGKYLGRTPEALAPRLPQAPRSTEVAPRAPAPVERAPGAVLGLEQPAPREASPLPLPREEVIPSGGTGGERKPSGEAGFIDPAAIGAAGAKGAKLARAAFASEITRTRDLGTPSARELADKGERAIDVAGRERGGFQIETEEAQKAAGRHPVAARHAGRLVYPQGSDTADARFYEVIHGREQPLPAEKRIFDTQKALLDKTGKGYENVGTVRIDSSGKAVLFQTPQNTAPFVTTHEGYEFFRSFHKHPGRAAFIKGVAARNGIPEADVAKHFDNLSDQLTGTGPVSSTSPERRSAAEFFRRIHRIPAAVRVGGKEVRILETDPHTYATRLSRVASARMGVIESFGQDIGDATPLADLRQRFIRENSGKGFDAGAYFDRFMRGAQAAPLNPRTEGALEEIAGRIVAPVMKVAKSAMLSTRAVSNVFEGIGGEIGQMAGAAGQFKTFYRNRIAPLLDPKAHAARIIALKQAGAISEDISNLTIRKGREIGDAARVLAETVGNVTLGRRTEWKQETAAAMSAQVAIERGMKPRGEYQIQRDIVRIEGAGFDKALAEKIARGQANPEEQATFVRAFVRRGMGANTSALEQSLVENHPISKALLWFQKYFAMAARQTALRTGKDFASMFGRNVPMAKRAAAAADFGEMLGRRLTSGAATNLLLAFVFKGTTGLKIAADELRDAPWKFALKSLRTALLGGPLEAFRRWASDGDSLIDAVVPYTVTREIWQATEAKWLGKERSGKYTDKNHWETASALLNRFVPIVRAIKQGPIDHTERDAERAAESEYWRWNSDRFGRRDFGEKEPSEFRETAKRGLAALLDGNAEEAKALLAEAQRTGKKSNAEMAAWLRSKKLLKVPDAPEVPKYMEKEERAKWWAKELMGLAESKPTVYTLVAQRDLRLEKYAASMSNRSGGLPSLPKPPRPPKPR